jgi:hypothetical protein
MMIIYDPVAKAPYDKPWVRTVFEGCFGDRTDSPSASNWVVPGTWPEWML